MIISITAEALLIITTTAKKSNEAGLSKLETIRTELESTIISSQSSVLKLAVEVQPHLGDERMLERDMYDKKKALNEQNGYTCKSVFLASEEMYVSDMTSPYLGSNDTPNGDMTETTWYKEAIKQAGSVYTTLPIISSKGEIRFTSAVALGDKETVVGIEYILPTESTTIADVNKTNGCNVIIITNDGIVRSSGDKELIGKSLVSECPEYTSVLSALSSVVSNEVPVNTRQRGVNYFAIKSRYDWTLIISEHDPSYFSKSIIPIIVVCLITAALFIVVISMYHRSAKTAAKIREDLEFRDRFLRHSIKELNDPLSKIKSSSSEENVKHSSNYEQEFEDIREASDSLAEQLKKIIAYSDIIRSEKNSAFSQDETPEKHVNAENTRYYRIVIYLALAAVLILCFYINLVAASSYGRSVINSKTDTYSTQLSEWVQTQKTILDTYSTVIENDPDLPKDYGKTVNMLNKLKKHYPDISACYVANPKLEQPIAMNTGWTANENYHVEEQDWYKKTMASKERWSVSSGYFDEKTGNYCITFSQRIYDTRTGRFLGVFALDFYLDKLIDIFDSSYTDSEYAFLVDSKNMIINHPFVTYQMNPNSSHSVFELPYHKASPFSDSPAFFTDYDGKFKAASAAMDERSNFSVYVVLDFHEIYKDILLYSLLSTAILFVCLILVYKLISGLIELQEKTNRNLRRSADAAIAADEAKSKFLAQMSHEIRTPINAVIGMNEMILRESADNTIREYAVNIQSAGRTLLSLINSILDFSKIEDGKMEIIPVNYDTASMIHDLVASVMPRAEAKGLKFIVNVDETLPAAMKGDDVRIKQIIMNLLTNAVKYTEEGSVTLVIKKESTHDDSVELYVEVSDTGIGIKEEDLDLLFDSFKRLEEKRNRNIEGTGLGMSIVTKLLDMMDSKLEVSSEYGSGSVFSFRIRQRIASPIPMGDYTSRIMKPEDIDTNPKHIYAPQAQVLIVDDNEMNIKVAVSMIKLYGIIPDTAGSGHEAIELCRTKKYNIIFMDHMMPILDGIETMKKLKSEGIIPDTTAVVALTANAIVGAREMYIGEGFNDYLTKPIESRKFEKMIEKFLPEYLVSFKKTELRVPEKKEEPNDPDSFTADELKKIHELCPEIDVLTGLGYCMDSREFYIDTLTGYLESNKLIEMQKTFNSGDIKAYGILAHSLKSTSKTIGAMVLSEHAKELEFAAKRDDAEYIKEHHESVKDEYKTVLNGIGEVLKNEPRNGN